MVIPIWLDDSTLNAHAFRVYAHLCCRAHTRRQRPLASIAAVCRTDIKTIRRAVVLLVGTGLASCERHEGYASEIHPVREPDVFVLEALPVGTDRESPVVKRAMVPEWFDGAGLDAITFRVAAHVARRQEATDEFFERQRVTARALRLGLATVSRALGRLREVGLLRPTAEGRWRLVRPNGASATTRSTPTGSGT